MSAWLLYVGLVESPEASVGKAAEGTVSPEVLTLLKWAAPWLFVTGRLTEAGFSE